MLCVIESNTAEHITMKGVPDFGRGFFFCRIVECFAIVEARQFLALDLRRDTIYHYCIRVERDIMQIYQSKIAKNKIFGTLAIVLGVFGFLIIIHRLSYYIFEYDEKFSPVDYGKFNILSFFTIQSNIFVYVYLICAGLASFGVKGADKVAYNQLVGAMATTYILVTGLVYTIGIPMGFTPPFKWHDAYHAMSSFIQVYFHMIIPPIMLILWFFPLSDRKVNHKHVWCIAIYPLVYSVFSIIRGAVGKMHFYPYPFYRPEFIWSFFFKTETVNYPLAYFLMSLVLIVGMLLFIGIGRLMILINDKRVDSVFKSLEPLYVKDEGQEQSDNLAA